MKIFVLPTPLLFREIEVLLKLMTSQQPRCFGKYKFFSLVTSLRPMKLFLLYRDPEPMTNENIAFTHLPSLGK